MSKVSAEQLWHSIADHIPMLSAMQVEVVSWDGQCLVLKAPIAVNQNDKGTGFAGSIATLSTIAGWALMTLWTQQAATPCWVAIASSDMRYLKPAYNDLFAHAELPNDDALAGFQAYMSAKGRAKIAVSVRISSGKAITAGDDDAEVVAKMIGQYAAWPKASDET